MVKRSARAFSSSICSKSRCLDHPPGAVFGFPKRALPAPQPVLLFLSTCRWFSRYVSTLILSCNEYSHSLSHKKIHPLCSSPSRHESAIKAGQFTFHSLTQSRQVSSTSHHHFVVPKPYPTFTIIMKNFTGLLCLTFLCCYHATVGSAATRRVQLIVDDLSIIVV